MRTTIFLLLCLGLWGCIDDIMIDLPGSEQQEKVIEGYVERDSLHYVLWGKVSLTQDVSGTISSKGSKAEIRIVYNDTIVISIEEGERTLIPVDSFHNQLGGTPEGSRWQLIAVFEGQEYRSSVQTMPEVPKPDSLSVGLITRTERNLSGNIQDIDYVSLRVHTPLVNERQETVSLQWLVTATYMFREGTRSNPAYVPKTCFVDYDVFRNAINIGGPADYPAQGRIDGLEIATTPNDFQFSIAAYFTVVQKSLNQESYDYWQDVRASNQRSGNIYDVFPGRIRSNIRNIGQLDEEINGFFHVSAVDTVRVKVLPEMIGRPVQRCALWMEPEIITADDPDPCLNCLVLFNSRLEQPHYWE